MTTPGTFSRAERLIQEPRPTPAEIFSLIEDRLQSVETMFRENLSSPIDIVGEIGDFVAHAGGKRIRPSLHLLAARLCEYDGPHDILLGTVLEYIHCATLIHDDIIDGATTRRGRPSVNFRWGNNITVLFGDYLYAKAMRLALRAESLRVMETLAKVTLQMIEGELLQTRYTGRIDLSLEEYVDLIERKTAALFSCCCELAGLLAGLDEDRLGCLRRYGIQLGMAFQVVDDLLDFTGDERQLGKPSAMDLREGKVTLPVIELLTEGSPRARSLVERVMECDGDEASEIEELKSVLHESGALKRAHQRAQQYAATSTLELAHFPENPAYLALQALPELLLLRDR